MLYLNENHFLTVGMNLLFFRVIYLKKLTNYIYFRKMSLTFNGLVDIALVYVLKLALKHVMLNNLIIIIFYRDFCFRLF